MESLYIRCLLRSSHCTGRNTNATSTPVYVGVDFGLTPAAFLVRRSGADGFAIQEIVAVNGHRAFCRSSLNELATRFAAASEVIIYGDPAGDFRAQTDESTPSTFCAVLA